MVTKKSRNQRIQKRKSKTGGIYLTCPDSHPVYCSDLNKCVKNPRTFLFNTITGVSYNGSFDDLNALQKEAHIHKQHLINDGNWIYVDLCNLGTQKDGSTIELINKFDKSGERTHKKFLVDVQRNKVEKNNRKNYNMLKFLRLSKKQWETEHHKTVLSFVQNLFNSVLGRTPTKFYIISNGQRITYDTNNPPLKDMSFDRLFKNTGIIPDFNNITFMEYDAHMNDESQQLVVVGEIDKQDKTDKNDHDPRPDSRAHSRKSTEMLVNGRLVEVEQLDSWRRSETVPQALARLKVKERIDSDQQPLNFAGNQLQNDFAIEDYMKTAVPPLMTEPLGEIQFFVKGLQGETIKLKAKTTDTVAQVKAQIHASTGIQPEEQILKYRGKTLESPGLTLADYDIEEGRTVDLRRKVKNRHI